MSIKRILARTAAGVFVLCLMARTVTFAWGSPSDTDQLISLGMHPAIAKKLVAIVNTLASPFANNTWVTVRNAANGANINVLKVDGTDDTVLNADTGDVIKLAVAGTAEATLDNDQLTVSGAAFQIVPGATSFSIRNNADAADNFIIADAGTATLTGQLTLPGINVPAANFETVAGAGSSVSDAAALSATKHIHQLTGANGTLGWKFASATAGQVEILLNTTAGVPKVYAVSGGTCNGGSADAACTLVTGIVAHVCYATAANAWICS